MLNYPDDEEKDYYYNNEFDDYIDSDKPIKDWVIEQVLRYYI